MKILSYVSKHSSPAYHRIILPLTLMPDIEVNITNDLHTSHFEGVDIFYYNRIVPDFAIKEINLLRKRYGFKIGIDIDDYWHLDITHPYKQEYDEKNFATLQLEQIMNADFITVTHERLAKVCNVYAKNIHILPNAIPQTGQFIEVEKVKQPENLIRLFWQGSNTHYADIAQIRDVTHYLEGSTLKNFIEMVLAGYRNDEGDKLIWERIATIYTGHGNLKHALLSPLHYEYYYHLYGEADVCLVPLRQSLFNTMKSNLKVLEAGNLKLPVICSKLNPYLNLPVRYASNTLDWIRHITDLVLCASKRKEEGEILHEYCKEHFNFEKINLERKQIFEQYTK